ncbi:MAG: helix-turn-helix transcriptional regulator [Halorhabdus sp.]
MVLRSRGAILALLTFLLCVGAVGTVVPASASDPGQLQLSDTDLQPENTTMWIQLQANGDARWTVSMTVELSGQQQREAFRDIADRFESGRTELLSIEPFRNFSDRASQATGRDMRIVNESRVADVSDGVGTLSVSFTWTSFGRVQDGRLYVGDAFDSPSGTWMPGLAPGHRLVIEAPDSFSIAETPSGITIVNETIRWVGPDTFEPSYIAIAYAVETPTVTSSTETMTPTPTTNTAATTTQPPGSTSSALPLTGLGVFGFVVIVVVLYAVRTGRVAGDDTESQGDDADGGDGAAPESPKTDTDASTSATESETPSTDETHAEAEDETDPIDRELLSDEEYVEALIERNGGRMKQANIVSETGWSNAKVSQLLSAMAEDGRIEKLRIGRENLISFPDEPDDAP